MPRRKGKSKRISLINIEKSFTVSKREMKRIIKDFHLDMERRLGGRKSSLKMIPAYIDRPTGNEKGKFMALDLGGTNFRILELALLGKGRCQVLRAKRYILDKNYITGSPEKLFDFIADCISGFLKSNKNKIELGYTFSFPIEQANITSGTLLQLTKGFTVKGIIGKDVVQLLNEAFRRKGIFNIKIAALTNDTVATLVAKSYEDAECDAAVILGTGTNACYVEKISNIIKRQGYKPSTDHMIINIEWGNFNKLKSTRYDIELDKKSENKGQQILEKMVSGMYLGNVASLVLNDLILQKIVNFKTEDISAIEGDVSPGLSEVNSLLKKFGIRESTLKDRKIIKKVCSLVSLRAARIVGACITAVLTKIDLNLSKKHTIAIDGSLYEKHPTFSRNIRASLTELLGQKARRIKISLTKDGSGKGAAIIAAIASHTRSRY